MILLSYNVFNQTKFLRRWKSMTILVTGGAGYIGSHTCIELVKAGYVSQEDVARYASNPARLG